MTRVTCILTSALIAVLAMICVGCGGGSGGSSLSLDPTRQNFLPGEQQEYVLFESGSESLVQPQWNVRNSMNALVPGAIDVNGVFTAPVTTGTYTIEATLNGQTATAQANVYANLSLSDTDETGNPITLEGNEMVWKLPSYAETRNLNRGQYASLSPNGFYAGQCTWYVDVKVSLPTTTPDPDYGTGMGWNLNFSQSSGRNACRWFDLVTNATKITGPHHADAGDIIVFDQWNGNPYGHVAWIKDHNSSDAPEILFIQDANWHFGVPVYTWDGIQVWKKKVHIIEGTPTPQAGCIGWVRVYHLSDRLYPLKGYLRK